MPTPEFNELELGFQVIFHKDIYTEKHLARKGLNERQIEAVNLVREKGSITNKEYQEICDISERTASRDLSVLVSQEIFEKIGKTGRGTQYILRRHNKI